MKSAIQELFYGNFAQIDQIKFTAEHRKLLDAVIECDEKLRELLKENAEALETYEKFRDVLDKSDCEELLAFYKEGFRNGFQIALDGMDED